MGMSAGALVVSKLNKLGYLLRRAGFAGIGTFSQDLGEGGRGGGGSRPAKPAHRARKGL